MKLQQVLKLWISYVYVKKMILEYYFFKFILSCLHHVFKKWGISFDFKIACLSKNKSQFKLPFIKLVIFVKIINSLLKGLEQSRPF